jgi:dienelactone hydrolase
VDRPAAVVALALAALLVACGPASSTSPTLSPAVSAVPSAASSPAADDQVAVARAFIGALARGDTAAAEAMEDAVMRDAAPAATLGVLWGQFEAQFGAFGGLGTAETAAAAPYTNVVLEGEFADALVPLIVTVTADGLVAGLHLGAPVPVASGSPAGPSPSPSPAAYVRPEAFTEREVTVGAEPWTLPGTLSMPVGDGPFPAVVLLAGSGPNDRDETIGTSGNAPLRDLAWGLASNGIAVLRYDKRTKVHAAAMAADVANVTVREETVDDAIAAVDLMRRMDGIDPTRVFVAGHSLGAYLAPRVAAEARGRVAGIAMLAAPSSPMQRLILAQLEYLASDEGGADPTAAAQLDAIRKQVALAESPTLSASTPASQLPLGIPAAYWLDLRTYDPLRTAAALPIAIFIAQGGRDYQVPPSELGPWRDALAGRSDVTISEYPALNHLMMAGSGPSRPAEYEVAGHVAEELVADLAAWVLEASRTGD